MDAVGFQLVTTIRGKQSPRVHGFGSVYVIEFSDGHIKIGRSATPEKRIKIISASNQHSPTRSWISEAVWGNAQIETAAHNHFKDDRVGGEFFTTDFDLAIAWIADELTRRQAA